MTTLIRYWLGKLFGKTVIVLEDGDGHLTVRWKRPIGRFYADRWVGNEEDSRVLLLDDGTCKPVLERRGPSYVKRWYDYVK